MLPILAGLAAAAPVVTIVSTIAAALAPVVELIIKTKNLFEEFRSRRDVLRAIESIGPWMDQLTTAARTVEAALKEFKGGVVPPEIAKIVGEIAALSETLRTTAVTEENAEAVIQTIQVLGLKLNKAAWEALDKGVDDAVSNYREARKAGRPTAGQLAKEAAKRVGVILLLCVGLAGCATTRNGDPGGVVVSEREELTIVTLQAGVALEDVDLQEGGGRVHVIYPTPTK